jgi:hypothetical protein
MALRLTSPGFSTSASRSADAPGRSGRRDRLPIVREIGRHVDASGGGQRRDGDRSRQSATKSFQASLSGENLDIEVASPVSDITVIPRPLRDRRVAIQFLANRHDPQSEDLCE